MKWTRGWFFVVALVAATAAAVALLVPQITQREVDLQVQMRLAAVSHGAEALLKLHSRKWLDVTAHAATDGTLGEALEAASHGASNAELLHRTAAGRLETWNTDWKAFQVIAVDVRGRVLARVAFPSVAGAAPGAGAGGAVDVWKDDLSKAAVVSEALRGYVLDDTWAMAGRLLRVTAAPVVVRDRYAGALLVAIDIGSELTSELHDMMGADLALVAGGKVVSRGGRPLVADEAPAFVKEHAAELTAVGRTEALPAGRGGELSLVAVALAGEAGAQDAALVFMAERPRLASMEALVRRFQPDQIAWLSLAPVGGALLFVLLIGFFMIGREHTAPLGRLLIGMQAASRGEIARIDDRGFGGRFGTLVRTINAALATAGASAVNLAERSIGGVAQRHRAADSLEPLPLRSAPEISLDLGIDSMSATPLPWPVAPTLHEGSSGGGQLLSLSTDGIGAAASYAPPASSPYGSSSGNNFQAPPAAAVSPAPAVHRSPSSAYDEPLDPSLPAQPAQPSLAARAAASMQRASASPGSATAGMLASLDEVSGAHLLLEPPKRPDYPRDEFGAAALGSSYQGDGSDGSGSHRGGLEPLDSPSSGLSAAPAAAAPGDPLEAEFRSVFHEFIDTRQNCGEATEGVTFEKFVVRLRGNRDQLMARYGCKGVRFQVYLKDGKAALKATPVNE